MADSLEFRGIDPDNPPVFNDRPMRLTRKALKLVIAAYKHHLNAPSLGGQQVTITGREPALSLKHGDQS